MTHVALVLVAVLAALAAVQAGKLPSYIDVCKRNDPLIEDCILRAVEKLKPQLMKGIPELDVPPLDPLTIKKLPISLGTEQAGFHAIGHDVLIYGTSNFKINKFKVNFEKYSFDVALDIPELYFIADYDVDARFSLFPLKGRGPVHANATKVTGDVTLIGSLVKRHGVDHMQFNTVEVELKIGSFHVHLENFFRGDPVLTDAVNNVINDNPKEFVESVMPILQRTVGNLLLDIANKIAKNLTFDEMFPKE